MQEGEQVRGGGGRGGVIDGEKDGGNIEERGRSEGDTISFSTTTITDTQGIYWYRKKCTKNPSKHTFPPGMFRICFFPYIVWSEKKIPVKFEDSGLQETVGPEFIQWENIR